MPENELTKLVSFYEEEIKPYNYSYNLMFGTNFNFTFDPSEICHLIFGTLKNKNIPKASQYKGQAGFDNIVNGVITTVPPQLRKAYKNKAPAFYHLPQLLRKPTAIYFNPSIVSKGSMGANTDIDGDFLLYKEINKKNIHLFIKWIAKSNKFVPYSLFQNTDPTYIANQLQLKILDSKITERTNS